MILEFFEKYEPIWLFSLLLYECVISTRTLRWIIREYVYDKEKDDSKKQRKTKTTKKTTTDKAGSVITEETNEIVEPMNEEKQK